MEDTWVQLGSQGPCCKHLRLPIHPHSPVCSQNLVLPDTFFSFYDLRREFHMQHPSTCSVRDLTVGAMAQGIWDPSELG